MKCLAVLLLGVGVGLVASPVAEVVRLLTYDGGDRTCLVSGVCVGDAAEALTNRSLSGLDPNDGIGPLYSIKCRPTEAVRGGDGRNSIGPTAYALGERCHSEVERLIYRTSEVHTVVTLADDRIARIWQESTFK